MAQCGLRRNAGALPFDATQTQHGALAIW